MEENVKEIIKRVEALAGIRSKIPQLLFLAPVFRYSYLMVRQEVLKFKAAHPKCEEIDLIINSGGGSAEDAYRIIKCLRNNFHTVNIIVPFMAKSAATLLALGGSSIIMDEAGEFGPLDAQLGKAREDSPQYDSESALNDEFSLEQIENRFQEAYETMFLRVYEHPTINIPKTALSEQVLDHLAKFYEPILRQIDPYKLGDKKRKLEIGTHYAMRLLAKYSKLDEMSIKAVVYFLVNDCPDHSFILDDTIMSGLLDNIKPANHWGEDYKRTLTDLSLFLIQNVQPPNIIKIIQQNAKKVVVNEEDKKPELDLSKLDIETLTENLEKSTINPKLPPNAKKAVPNSNEADKKAK